jgi:hypothetical protein
VYRGHIRASLLVEARLLVIDVMIAYRHSSGGKPISVASFADSCDQIDAICASGRLGLRFEGLLLFGS